MKTLVQNFTNQLREAKNIAEKAIVSKSSNIHNIVVTGLGGSGIGGTIVLELLTETCKVPFLVNKDYFLPEFVGKETLVIVSSYSGNTEETLNAMEVALERGAKVVCITSGGRIMELAKETNSDCIVVPGGMPPRTCLGFSLTQLFFILNFYLLF